MRVLHVTPSVADRYGGTSRTVLELSRSTRAVAGIQTEIAATDADGPNRSLSLADCDTGAVPLHLFHRDFSERWKFSRRLRAWLFQHARDYDLVQVHGIWSFATAVACRAAQHAGVPVVLMPHGMLSPYSLSRSVYLKRSYWCLLERTSLAIASRLQVTSNAEADEIRKLGIAAQSTVIPLGLEPLAWDRPRKPDWLREQCRGAAGSKPIILFLSRLHKKKGIVDLLLPAFAELSLQAHLVIAGGTDSHDPTYGSKVRRAIDSLGLQAKVSLLGSIGARDRWSAFDGAALFVLPSHHENFGVVTTEAMARGAPVVVSEEVQSCDHVRAAGAGHVIPLQVSALTVAMHDLLANPEKRAEMGQRGREYTQGKLNWHQIATQVVEMYHNVCAT